MKKHSIWMVVIAAIAGTVCAEPAAVFKKWDKDKDGQLSKEEFTVMTKTQMEKKGKKGYAEAAEKRFKQIDKDKNGFLSEDEYVSNVSTSKKK